MEFGVAGGNGLVELEKLAQEVEKEFPVEFEIYGFDSGMGLPAPQDYRDLPYIWKEGFFHMDLPALKARLARSTLVMGDVAETVPRFFEDYPDAAPIGAIFSDLDYYSSTRDSLGLLKAPDQKILPRVYLYFDDIMSAELGGLMCDEVGQLKAISEYNSSNEFKKLAPIHGMQYTRKRPARWNEQIYIHHSFSHNQYAMYVHSDSNRQLPLTNRGLNDGSAI
ncbi:hypothetical protein MNKW57_20510 [Biformimicrobium ophioploci]|uniref:Uncharacterized protein n=1 Tax=Biformimicrobium ophioploci TaxID=3036711 RepID=A0ABQ6M058_9GAMM|nr:hypothetical protein MNKW57_20510 [Microbulbifer sp. NKW57]